jgi:hypothetical protein
MRAGSSNGPARIILSMAGIAATSIRTNLGRIFKGVDDDYFYELFTEADKLLVRHFGYRKKTVYMPVVAEEGEIDLDSQAVWIETLRWIGAPNSTPGRRGGSKLIETNIDEEDVTQGDWRANSPGTPQKFMQTHDLVGGQLQFDCPSTYGTLTVLTASAASPCVITLSDDHGLSDGDRLDIYNAEGMTGIDGGWYAKVDGYAANELALYSDEDLATAVDMSASAAYTASTAIVSCTNSPVVEAFTRWHETITEDTTLPDTPFFKRLFVNQIAALYAEQQEDSQLVKFKTLAEDAIAEQIALTIRRTGRKHPRMTLIQTRELGYVESRW